MAKIVACPDCGHKVSAAAGTCPGCGVPVTDDFWDRLEFARYRDQETAKKVGSNEARSRVIAMVLIACGLIMIAVDNTLIRTIGVFLTATVLVLLLGSLPGSIARQRGHQSAQAIAIMGWLGLILTGGILWIVALAWAFVGTPQSAKG